MGNKKEQTIIPLILKKGGFPGVVQYLEDAISRAFNEGDWDGVLVHVARFEELLEIQPTLYSQDRLLGHKIMAKMAIARSYDFIEQYGKAAEVYREIIELKDDWPPAHYRFGLMQVYKNAAIKSGLAHLRMAAKLNPSNPHYATAVVNGENQLRKFKKFIKSRVQQCKEYSQKGER